MTPETPGAEDRDAQVARGVRNTGAPHDASAGPAVSTRTPASNVPDDLLASLDCASEEVRELIEGHRPVRDGVVWGTVMMVLAVGYGLFTATPWTAWMAPFLPLVGAGFGWWGWRRVRHLLTPLPDHPVGPATKLAMLPARVDALSSGDGIQVWGHSLTRVASWFQLVVGGGLAVVAVGAWFLQDHPVSTLGIALLGLGLAGLGGIMLADGRRQEAIGAVGAELQRLSRRFDDIPDASTPIELRERIAAQNELDGLRDERKQWIQIVGFGVPGALGIQYLLGELESVGDVALILVAAVVIFGVLARPVFAKGDRIRELEARLGELDDRGAVGESGTAHRADQGERLSSAAAAQAPRPGKGA